MATSAKARIAYTGEALENGEMDIRELAPALIAFADLVDYANKALGGEQKIRVLLNQDSIQRGSFDITFIMDVSLWEQARLFMGWTESTINDLLTSLGWGTLGKAADVVTVGQASVSFCVGIFVLLKKIAGRKVTRIENKSDKSEITLADGDKITTDNKTVKIFLDIHCRISIEKVLEPLKREGIDSFELRNPNNKEDVTPIENVSKAELPNFVAPNSEFADDKFQPSAEQEAVFEIISVNFGGKWRLSDGNGKFWASIDDEQFLSDVKKRKITFGYADMLKVRYYTQQEIHNGKPSTEYHITKVVNILMPNNQIDMEFNDYSSDSSN